MKENNPINKSDWPRDSTDLNPTENLFSWMKNKLQRKPIFSIKELKVQLEALWESITPELLVQFYKSMKRWCEMVVETEGYSIKY